MFGWIIQEWPVGSQTFCPRRLPGERFGMVPGRPSSCALMRCRQRSWRARLVFPPVYDRVPPLFFSEAGTKTCRGCSGVAGGSLFACWKLMCKSWELQRSWFAFRLGFGAGFLFWALVFRKSWPHGSHKRDEPSHACFFCPPRPPVKVKVGTLLCLQFLA